MAMERPPVPYTASEIEKKLKSGATPLKKRLRPKSSFDFEKKSKSKKRLSRDSRNFLELDFSWAAGPCPRSRCMAMERPAVPYTASEIERKLKSAAAPLKKRLSRDSGNFLELDFSWAAGACHRSRCVAMER